MEAVTIECAFTLHPRQQFDQAGCFVRYSPQVWLKCGIEYVDKAPKLSCVVTNTWSDWSTQPWHMDEIKPQKSKIYNKVKETEKKREAVNVDDDQKSGNCVTIALRVSKCGDSFVVEARDYDPTFVGNESAETKNFEFIRICRLDLSGDMAVLPLNEPYEEGKWDKWSSMMEAGVFACCPARQEGDSFAEFHSFTIVEGTKFSHDASGNSE